VSSNYNDGYNWDPPGTPTLSNCVEIPAATINPIVSTNPAYAYSLFLTSATSNLNISTNNTITVQNNVRVNSGGIFQIENNGSLVQLDDVVNASGFYSGGNTGNITYKRTAGTSTNPIRFSDYVYWSSPVAGQTIGSIYSTPTPGSIYKWNPLAPNSNSTITTGNWVGASGLMETGKGYIVRGSNSSSFAAAPIPATFTGVPNNGIIPFTISRGNYTGPDITQNNQTFTKLTDNYNLLGNPYPSSISCYKFLTNNSAVLTGAAYIWTHGTPISNTNPSPYYQNYTDNYNPNDYIPYNLTGSPALTGADDYYIGAGQGFFVTMRDDTSISGSSATVNFRNSFRDMSYGNATGINFFKTTNTTVSDQDTLEFNRIWLDFAKENQPSVRTMFGYVTGATMQKDNLHDAVADSGNYLKIYTLVDNENFVIQGRALPFDLNDEVSIGINAPLQGNYTIAIVAVDGLFNNQNIYLKDNLLNITHNLKVSPYNFTTQSGEFNYRFKIVYISNALGINNPNEINTFAMIFNNTIRVESSELIKEITVYDIAGKLINTYLLNEYKNQFTGPFNYANGVYIAKITLENNMVVSKKLIH
jgi:hypothetical protein